MLGSVSKVRVKVRGLGFWVKFGIAYSVLSCYRFGS